MANVTQRINSYLGGVSKQPDTKKLPGQVRDIINGYPDTTFGLTKRPGFKFISTLSGTSNVDTGKWFLIKRSDTEIYIGVIIGGSVGDVRIWNATTGAACTVSSGTNQTYLKSGTPGKDDFDLVTIQDTSIIVNKKSTVTSTAAPTYNSKRRATARLLSVDYGAQYQIVLTTIPTPPASPVQTTVTYTTYDSEKPVDTSNTGTQAENRVTAQAILSSLQSTIDGTADYAATIVGQTIEITSSTVNFNISSTGGLGKEGLVTFQDSVDNFPKLPSQTVHDRVVRITNSSQAEDDYYLKFIADNGVSGTGYWEETVAPDVSTGLTATTMPHILVNTALNTFTFGVGSNDTAWQGRLVGDDLSNPMPTFVGTTIKAVFFYNNRLGFLTDDTVILSRAGDYFNFFNKSALALTVKDPIDVNVNAVRPSTLSSALPVPQGLLLFSQYQQFLLTGDAGIITPTNTVIKSLSSYESDSNIKPVDVGTKVGFIGKSAGYTHFYEMITRGQDDPPIVQDVSRIVSEWIPSTIDNLLPSPNNNLVLMSDRSSRYVYGYRTYSNGERELMQCWFRWELPANVQTLFIEQDLLFTVTKYNTSYILSTADINQTPSSGDLISNSGQLVNPNVDLYKQVTGTLNGNDTRFLIPYTDHTNLTPVIIVEDDGEAKGYYFTPTRSGNYFVVANENLVSATCYVGYVFDYKVEFPRFYYQLTETSYDFTAHLTIARLNISVGRTGQADFKLKRFNEADWISVNPVQQANYYDADDVPVSESYEFKIPIHQKNTNFDFQLMSQTPYPLSLLSCMWEGMYNPRSYRRT